MSASLQINGDKWEVSVLGEQALLIKPLGKLSLSKIHACTAVLENTSIEEITDILPAYDSIALIYDRMIENVDLEVKALQERCNDTNATNLTTKKIRVPVCYTLGSDWDEVESHTSLNRTEIIQKHTESIYAVAMMGFIPGFLYLQGLDDSISCPRKASPKTKVPAGSVGIAGNQTGIYSLESPGGWQIIGRTPHSFFDSRKTPPCPLNPGDKIEFYAVSETEFEQLRSGDGS